MKSHYFIAVVLGFLLVSPPLKAIAEDPSQNSSAVVPLKENAHQINVEAAPKEFLTLEDFEIPGGPPARMLQDFNAMFPEADFYEGPSKEIKEQFIKKFPIWGLVIHRIEKDDEKRNRAEDFFESKGHYPTAEDHGDLPLSDYLMDYLEYEKEGAAAEPKTASTDLEAEIKVLFPGWSGSEITPDMQQKFEQSFAGKNFGSWNPLFYGDLYQEETSYADEDVDEGLVYEGDNTNKTFPGDNWLADEVVEKTPKTESASPSSSSAAPASSQSQTSPVSNSKQ